MEMIKKMYKIVVYEKTKSVCMPCRFTKRELEKHQWEVELRALEDLSDTQLEMFRNLGLSSAPIVQVFAENGILLDEWSGHNVNKLKEYIKEA